MEHKIDCREFLNVPFRNIIVVELSSSLSDSTEEPEHLGEWGFFWDRSITILGLKLKMDREGNWGLKAETCWIADDVNDGEGEIKKLLQGEQNRAIAKP